MDENQGKKVALIFSRLYNTEVKLIFLLAPPTALSLVTPALMLTVLKIIKTNQNLSWVKQSVVQDDDVARITNWTWDGTAKHYDECPSYKQHVDLRDHKCFIQRLKTPAEQLEEEQVTIKKWKRGNCKQKSRKRGPASNEPDEKNEDEDDEELPPILFFFFYDIESMQTKEQHEPSLLIAQKEDKDTTYHFEGPDRVKTFLE